MSSRDKFLTNFKIVSHKYSNSISIYYVLDAKNTLGITYLELNKVSNELSCYFLKTFGDNPQYIGVSVSDCFHLPFIILGLWKSGYYFAGIGSQYTSKSTLNFLNFLHVKYLISDDCNEKLIENVISNFYIHDQKFYISQQKDQTKQEKNILGGEDICYGIMTSGSTGIPKIIQVPWNCILPNVIELADTFEILQSDCIFQASPCTFDPFFIEFLLVLLNGSSLMIVSKHVKLCSISLLEVLFERDDSDIKPLITNSNFSEIKNIFMVDINKVARKCITVLQMTPSLFKRWSNDDIKKSILSQKSVLKVLVLGGEKFPTDILKLKCPKNNTRIFNIYGITEISCWAFLNEITDQLPNSEVSLGKPLSSITYYISKSNELFIGSKFRFCIVNDESNSQTKDIVFRNSGDIVVEKNRELYYLGRSNQIVKKYGIKINLKRIEEYCVEINKSIKECHCVFDEVSLKLALFYVPNVVEYIENNYVAISLERFLEKGYLFPYEEIKDIEKPDYIVEIYEVPLNSHGKCDRQKLLSYLLDIQKSQLPDSDLNKLFSKFWRDALGLDKPNLYSDSFVNLGGNSILGIEIINKLEDMNIKVPQNFITELLGGGSYESCLKCLSHAAESTEIPKKLIKIEDHNNIIVSINWKFDLGKCVDATPTLLEHQGNEKIIIGSHSFKLTCLHQDSGNNVWTIFLGDRIESGFTVTKDETRGYVGCYDHFVYCIDVVDGKINWKYKTGEMVKSTPRLSSNEKILYVSSYDKHLHCLSASDGKVLSKLKLSDGGIYCSGIVSDLLNSFYTGTLDGTCVALDQENNQIRWKTKLKSPIFSSPCMIPKKSQIIFAEVLGVIHCLDAFNGTKVWSYEASGNIYSSPIILNWDGLSHIIIGCHDNHLYCLKNRELPELKWKQQLDSYVFSRPCAVEVSKTFPFWMVCTATTKGFVYLCDLTSGSVKTRVKLGGEIFSSPVYRKNRLFVGCRDNYIYSLDISNSIFPDKTT